MFQPKRAHSLSGNQFRVKFTNWNDESIVVYEDFSFLDFLSSSVVTTGPAAAVINLERKISATDPNVSDGEQAYFEIQTFILTHRLPANKIALSKMFQELRRGIRVNVAVQLVGAGIAQDVVLYELNYENVLLRIVGDLKLGSEADMIVNTMGIVSRPIKNLTQDETGIYHYEYDEQNNHPSK